MEATSTNVTKGASLSQTWGADAEMMLGPTMSMMLGGSFDISVTLAISIASGFSLELYLGWQYELRVGPKFEFYTSESVAIGCRADLQAQEQAIMSRTTEVRLWPMYLGMYLCKLTQKGSSATTSGTDVTVAGNQTVI